MPSTYYPNATVPTVGASHSSQNAILSSTNATPIAITTTLNGTTPGAHGFSTGDCVEIVGHDQLGANGVWQITVTSTTAFTLDDSTPTGAGGRHGNARTTTIDPSFTLPSDGTDRVTAASVNQFAEGASNAIPFLYNQTGKYRLVDSYYVDNTGEPPVPWVNYGGTPGTTAIVSTNIPQRITWSVGLFNHFQSGFAGYLNPPGLLANDLLDVMIITEASASFGTTYTAPAYAPQLGLGVAVDGSTSFSLIAGSYISLPPDSSGNYAGTRYYQSLTLRNTWTPGPTPHKSFDLCLMANLYNVTTGAPASSVVITPTGVFSCIVNHYRLNGGG